MRLAPAEKETENGQSWKPCAGTGWHRTQNLKRILSLSPPSHNNATTAGLEYLMISQAGKSVNKLVGWGMPSQSKGFGNRLQMQCEA